MIAGGNSSVDCGYGLEEVVPDRLNINHRIRLTTGYIVRTPPNRRAGCDEDKSSYPTLKEGNVDRNGNTHKHRTQTFIETPPTIET
jgi:hypothetical protein